MAVTCCCILAPCLGLVLPQLLVKQAQTLMHDLQLYQYRVTASCCCKSAYPRTLLGLV
jgi:hypothetical protein